MNKPAPAVAIPSEEVARTLETGRTLFPGFRCVDTLSDLDDDEYESEEESYLVLDLGATMDSRTLQTEAAYQLIVRLPSSLTTGNGHADAVLPRRGAHLPGQGRAAHRRRGGV